MVSRIWIGGGTNQASDPADWSPTGSPQPGDTLLVAPEGHSPNPATINVQGNDLQGNLLRLSHITATINLSQQAVARVDDAFSPTLFRVTQASTLTLENFHSDAFVSLVGSSLNLDAGYGNTDVEVAGNSTMILTSDERPATTTVTLDANATLSGSFDAPKTLSMHGSDGSRLILTGDSTIDAHSHALLDVDVSGNRTISVAGRLEFAKSASGVSVSDSGVVQIDHIEQFTSGVTLASAKAEIDLVQLVNADAWTFKNDMLSVLSGKTVIGTLQLHDSTNNGFAVVKVTHGVNVVALEQDHHLPPHSLPQVG